MSGSTELVSRSLGDDALAIISCGLMNMEMMDKEIEGG